MKKCLLAFLSGMILFSVNLSADDHDSPFLSKSFNAASINKVTVSTAGGSIKVYGGANNEATVEMYVLTNGWPRKDWSKERIQQTLDENYDIIIEEKGGVLTASAKRKEGIQWSSDNGLSISFVVNTKPNADVEVRTSGGSLQLHNITGTVEGKTSGGSIKISKLRNEHIRLRTSGGSIKAEECSGNISLKTSGGSIHLEELQGTIDAKTSGGSIRLEGLNGTINAKTSGGSIEGNSIKGTLITGTSGGSVHLKDIAANLEASTSAGSMKVSMEAVKEYVRLKTSGSVSLEVPRGGYDVDIHGRRINNKTTDFRGEFDSEKSMKGTIGTGGAEINIRSSGRVEIRFKE